MFKKILLFNVIIYLLASSAFAEIINKITINGNKRLSPETITLFADVNLGTDYKDDDLNDILKKLYDSGFLQNVNLKIVNNILEINVVENPIIENIEILGIENEKLKEALSDNFILKSRQSYVENKFINDRNKVESFLKQLGYYFSKVETSFSKNEELNSINLTYDITLGEKARISEIQFIGNKYFKDRKLSKIITSEVDMFWKFLSKKTYLDSNRINLDKRLLENYFKDSGFYNVNILDSFVESKSDKTFKIIFNIDSGEKFYFNKINLVLPQDFEPKYFSSIEKASAKLIGKKYSLSRVNKILEEVDKVALSKQYEFIDAVIEEKIIDNNKIDFTISMKETEKFYVEKINILGNQYTKEEVIRNILIVDEGDPFNELLFNKSLNNIKSKGIFAKVDKNIKAGSKPSLKTIDIIIEEKPTGEISLGAGAGTSGGTIGGGVKEKNFMGSGVTLTTNVALTADSLKGEFTVVKPNFNYSDNTLFTSIKSSSVDKLTDSGFKSTNNSISLGTEFQQFDNYFFNPAILIENEKIDTISSASTNMKKQDGNHFDIIGRYGINYDLRDRSFQPRDGRQIQFYQELPLVSDTSEIINTINISSYHSLTNDVIGRASLYMKAAHSLTGDDVRLSKRVYMPGSKLRGFESGKVGPKDSNSYVGGNYSAALNFSASLPKLLAEFQNTDLSIFLDMANVWGVDYDNSIKDSNQIRSAAGVAIDIMSAVGPMTFSLAQPITKLSSDTTETFRFNIGTTF